MNVYIEKIEIVSFGKLKNAVVEANRGINLLSAPNESGKTTLASFIKFALYGFSGARMQTLSENERKLYTPWDGELAAGAITVNADGTRYVVERRCAPSGKETVNCFERATGKAAFAGLVPGEALFGVSEEIFTRTLFFRQLTVPQARDDLLADRLQNIAISADEQVNTGKAAAKLNDAKNELKGRAGSGLIPLARRRSDELSRSIEESLSLRAECESLRGAMLERASTMDTDLRKIEKLNAERRNIERYDAFLKLQNISRLAREEASAREDYERSAASLKSLDGINTALRELSNLNSEYVAEKTRTATSAEKLNAAESELKELEDQIPYGFDRAKEAGAELKKYGGISNACFIAAAALAVIGAVLFFAVNKLVGGLFLGVAAAAVGAGAAFIAKRLSVAHELGFDTVADLRRELEALPEKEASLNSLGSRISALRAEHGDSFGRCASLKSRLDEGIGKYIDSDGGDYSSVLDTMLSLSTDCGQKQAVWNIKREEYERAAAEADVAVLAEEARGAEKPGRERAEVDRELNFYNKQYEQLSALQHRDELSCAAYESRSGDPAALVGKKRAVDARIADMELKYRAYEAAIAAINESGDYMKSMVAPRISARADEYFAIATAGKYSAFEVDTRLSMSFGADFRRSCEYLSAGTRDSAYLCLRLALADMLFGGNAVPMILDDAFVRIDDDRLCMMARALAVAAEKHQIFILTHGDRERNAFKSVCAECSELKIRTV